MLSLVLAIGDVRHNWRKCSFLTRILFNQKGLCEVLSVFSREGICDTHGIRTFLSYSDFREKYNNAANNAGAPNHHYGTHTDVHVVDSGDQVIRGDIGPATALKLQSPPPSISQTLPKAVALPPGHWSRKTSSSPSAASASNDSPSPSFLYVLGAMASLVRSLGGGSGGSTGNSASLGGVQITFGLQALSRRHEAQGMADHPPGQQVASAQVEAERLLDALELAHGAYRRSAAALAATTCLRAQHVRVWRPEGGSLQPGYFVAVDPGGRRVLWGIRGTRVFSDLLTDLAMAAHPLGPGEAHWGMTHAANWIVQREANQVAALLRSLGPPGSYRLQLVGHSMGGAVAALVAVMLRERLVEAARIADIPPETISCVAFASPAVMSPQLSEVARPYVTSVVLNNDIVPRFNAHSLKSLQEELREVDWFAELQQIVMEHALVKSLSSTLEALRPGTTATATEAPQQENNDLQQPAVVAATHTATTAATMVQQLSAAVLESAAFKSAVQSLEEVKARAMLAAGDQAEAAMLRQVELVQRWLQDLAAPKQPPAELRVDMSSSETKFPPQAGEGFYTGDAVADVRRAAEAAAERLRVRVESALASLTAAATVSKERLSASLPSLPQPHELPLVQTTASLAATATVAEKFSPSSAVSRVAALAPEECIPRDNATAAAMSGEGWADAAVVELKAPGGSASPHLMSQELPLLLPPGRILYIRPISDGRTKAMSSEQQKHKQPVPSFSYMEVPGDVSSRLGRRAGSGSRRGSGGGSSAAAPRQGYAILELPVGEGFRRLVLGRSAMNEHQCRAYRRVLMQLAFKEVME